MDEWPFRMLAKRNQHTLAGCCAVEGFGYWSGRDVRVEFRPAAANAGIVFVRGDLPGCPRIPATVEFRADAQRRTNLKAGRASVEMVEHIMAALAGLQVDNCEVWADQPEMPGCDGSALPFVRAMDAVGVVAQDAPRPERAIRQSVRLGTEDCWIEARPCCSGRTILQYALDYGSEGPIGRQSLEIVLSPETFRAQLAPCRTFMLKRDAEAIQSKGLALRPTAKDLLVFDDRGPVDNQVRFPDECVRHKLLDMAGDLALAGCDLAGRISAYRSGHQLNAELVQTVLAQQNAQLLRRCA